MLIRVCLTVIALWCPAVLWSGPVVLTTIDGSVTIEGDLLKVSAEYYRRRATGALGSCVGGPGSDTIVHASARLTAADSTVVIEVVDLTTESMPELTAMLMELAGVTLPMRHEFNLLGALNGILQEQKPFGLASLEIHDVVVADDAVTLQATAQMGLW